ncbi:S8 family serine peptidase [Cognaticolwellia mytili]|uniref:S8 family serine peptidase n=1 Tax=Cognaticolwellia mytili TaxID=1888913 RepID=UPI000A16E063|nr:S8 family serine peptidase [Cognaticolwellia mytili]
MQFKKSIIGSLVTLVVTASSGIQANEIIGNTDLLKEVGPINVVKKRTSLYIVQMKEQPGVAQAQAIGELLPSNQTVGVAGNSYNASTPAMVAYTNALQARQDEVASEIGSLDIIHSFKHTFNGFSAKLTEKQKNQLESHPDIIGVWEDEIQTLTTSNTPEFLGLTGPGGQHTLDIKGEDVVIGILDTGIVPEHPSFADDGTYSDPATFGWAGTCDAGQEAAADTFKCNNKLIGARFFNESFKSVYEIQTTLGEFISPRDADGHGSHTASTAGGNANVAAVLSGADAGIVSGIAPRARVSVYKVCWNSDYETPEGVKERGCFPSDSMAAIDQAVIDGVDVINFSIGGSRTDLTQPAAAAMLRATQAGVFVAVSAGNDGPDVETIGTPAPWITTVGASTYNGTSKVIGKELDINAGDAVGTSLVSVPAAFAPAANGLSGDLVASESVEACDTDDGTNPIMEQASLAGKVALISRGSCSFTEKFLNAQEAGATAVIVYTYVDTAPFAMGGTDPAVTIPGSMVSFNDGQALLTSIGNGETNITFSDTNASIDSVEVGNTMADFSSRGPNTASYDIIKPDITAPGVKILAATTNTPMFEPHGATFKYLQGTSMSSPHIAGMAALFKGSNPEWSPSQIKSALMTTARQDITKEDGTTPADPFDFGAGHAAPVDAMDPGLVYSANYNDYLAFLCGIGNETFVAGSGTTCAALTAAGFSTEPSQLNIASIGIAELAAPESISRTVTNVSGTDSIYTATIVAPEGVNVSLTTFDAEGNANADNSLVVAAGGTARYALNFAKNDSAVIDEWKFGSITWTDSAGHTVRSPIAIKAAKEATIEVPENISVSLTRGRASFPVKMLYTGRTSIDYAGLVAPFGSTRTVTQDADQDFSFNEAGLGTHLFEIPEGTKVARFSLIDGLIGDGSGATDLDLYVYRCTKWSCTRVDQSLNGGSNETVTLVNPEPRTDASVGDTYLIWIHGYDLAGAETLDYTMPVWIADGVDASTRISSSRRAIKDRFNHVRITTRGLTEGTYMGGITFYDDKGEAQGTTAIQVNN